jgi:hypothetical protein
MGKEKIAALFSTRLRLENKTRIARWLVLGVVGIVVSGAVLAGMAGPAAAAGCSGQSCNGADPYVMGCANDANSAGHTDYYDGSTGAYVHVDLMWSPSCQTNWGVASFDDGNPSWTQPVYIVVVGTDPTNGPNNYNTYPYDYQYAGSGSPVWGNMVYSPGCAFTSVTRGNFGGTAVERGCPTPTGP